MKSLRQERGVALVIAVFALVVIGTLVAAAFFIGVQQQRVGRNTLTFQQALSAAEEGLTMQVSNWNSTTYNAMAIGDSVTFTGTLPGNAAWYRGTLTRLNPMLYFIRSEGFSADSLSRQHVGLLIRLRPLELQINAALETQGRTELSGSAFLDGSDGVPAGWTCPPAGPARPGIRMTDSTELITRGGCRGWACLTGDPKVEEDPTIDSTSLMTFGDADFSDLRQFASKILPPATYTGVAPVVAGGECVTSEIKNWGEPLAPGSPCADYFPFLYADGSISVNGVRGQGVLVVAGDLNVQGGFEFFGPVIILGRLSTQGIGGHFTGGVIAGNVSLDRNQIAGAASAAYSSCALARALIGSAVARPLDERSWANLY